MLMETKNKRVYVFNYFVFLGNILKLRFKFFVNLKKYIIRVYRVSSFKQNKNKTPRNHK